MRLVLFNRRLDVADDDIYAPVALSFVRHVLWYVVSHRCQPLTISQASSIHNLADSLQNAHVKYTRSNLCTHLPVLFAADSPARSHSVHTFDFWHHCPTRLPLPHLAALPRAFIPDYFCIWTAHLRNNALSFHSAAAILQDSRRNRIIAAHSLFHCDYRITSPLCSA
jgi:hypothetical protein